MYVEINGEKIPVISAYEDQRIINGLPRPAVHIHSPAPLDASALLGKPVIVMTDDGEEARSFEPCSALFLCETILIRESEIEKELVAVKAERDALRIAKTSLETDIAALRKGAVSR